MQYIYLGFLVLLLSACGGGSGSETNNTESEEQGSFQQGNVENYAEGFYAPNYQTNAADAFYISDLSAITARVIANQDQLDFPLLNFSANNSDSPWVLISSDSGNRSFRLTNLYKNDCPETIENCDETDSSLLGVNDHALIVDTNDETFTVTDQSERGTCVAFSVNGALDILLDRQGYATNLSEQNTYYEGKKLTNTWNDAGLPSQSTIQLFVESNTKFVEELYWPYNSDEFYCSDYLADHPNATCSTTEAQAGGDDYKQQDPQAAASSGIALTTAHQLYASLGRIKQALHQGFPVMVSLNANQDFMMASLTEGVVAWNLKVDDCGASVCGHAVVAIGYQDDEAVNGGGYLIIKNSWSDQWGDNGLAYLTYEWVERSLLDAQAFVAFGEVQAQEF